MNSLNLFMLVWLFSSVNTLSPYQINEQLMGDLTHTSLRYGDVIVSPKQRIQHRYKMGVVKNIVIKERSNNRWPNNEIPYIISDKYSLAQAEKIKNAFKTLEQNSCFKFVPRDEQRDYLYIEKMEGCFSFVGKIGGRQLVSLAAGCLYDYIIWHELMHALGLEHEHQRPDRDNFIQIQTHNVDPEKMVNFEKISHDDVDLYHDYDYNSIMHYDGTAFGRMDPQTSKPLVTMVPLKMGVMLTDNLNLTPLDSEKLRILGKCESAEDFERFNNVKRSNASLRQKMYKKSKQNLSSTSSTQNLENNSLPTSCNDHSYECEKLRIGGFCKNPRYKKLMVFHCRATCNLCSEDK